MSDLPVLLPRPRKVSVVLWYGSLNDLRGVVYETTDFGIELNLDKWEENTLKVEAIDPKVVDNATFIREQK